MKTACCSVEINSVLGRPTYAAQVARWLHEAWPADYPSDDAHATAREWVQGRDGRRTWVARDCDGRAVGMFSLTHALCPELRPVTTLMALFVVAERRHLGVGGQLCEAAADAARRRGLADLYLYTDTAEDFYARLGWRKVADAVDLSQPTPRRLAFMKFGLHGASR